MFIYIVEPNYSGLVRPKLSWLHKCPLFKDKNYLPGDIYNGVDVILLTSCTPTFYYD